MDIDVRYPTIMTISDMFRQFVNINYFTELVLCKKRILKGKIN